MRRGRRRRPERRRCATSSACSTPARKGATGAAPFGAGRRPAAASTRPSTGWWRHETRPQAARRWSSVLLGTVVLTGCDFDVYKLPLPGGTDVGDDPMTVTVQFTDVLDLVPKTSVKVNDVNVGKVTDIELTGHDRRRSPSSCSNDTELPENAVAEIRQTSLLGEKFVSLEAAGGRGARGRARRRRQHPARAHRPQPGGRGGPRRAEPGAQRRRRRPAEDHRQRAQPGARGPRGRREVGAHPGRVADGPARREQGRHRRRDRVAEPAGGHREGAAGQHRRRARGAAERAGLGQPAARRPGQDAAGAQRARRRRGPGDQGSPRTSPSRRSGSCSRCSPSWPTPATRSSTRSTSS